MFFKKKEDNRRNPNRQQYPVGTVVVLVKPDIEWNGNLSFVGKIIAYSDNDEAFLINRLSRDEWLRSSEYLVLDTVTSTKK
jgi:hypothetical protein